MRQPSPAGMSLGTTLLLMAVVVGLVLIIVPLLFGRGEDQEVAPTASPTDEQPSPNGADVGFAGTWQLTEGVVDGRPLVLEPGHRVTLIEEPTGFSGTAGCNHYGARVVNDGSGFRFDEMQMTAMGCEPDVMALESAYIEGFGRVRQAVVDERGRLVLSGPGVQLRFAPQPAVPLDEIVDRLWILEQLVGDGLPRRVAGEPVTLKLGSDGTLTGSTGSRTLTGTYRLAGDEISMTELAAEGPDPPPALQAQDSHVVSVLERFTARVDGDRLVLTGPGNIGLVYRLAAESQADQEVAPRKR